MKDSSEVYVCSITQDAMKSDFVQMALLRDEYYYDNPFDERYWSGGIYGRLSVAKLIAAHKQDSTSTFVLVHNNAKLLVAYARFSFSTTHPAGFVISKLHIILCAKRLAGQLLSIKMHDKVVVNKLSCALLMSTINYCQLHHSQTLVSEICIFPYPNLPSLRLHKEYGFVSIEGAVPIVREYNKTPVQFIALSRQLVLDSPVKGF